MFDPGHDLAPCSTIGAKLVRDDALGQAPLLLHQPDQKTPGSLGVAASLDDLVENVAVLVDSTPKPMLAAADRHHDLVQMPYISRTRRFPTQAPGIIWPELLRPTADGLIGNDDAAFQKHLFHMTQAQWKPEIQPDRVRDHRSRLTMALVAERVLAHGDEIAANLSPEVNLTSPEVDLGMQCARVDESV